MMIQGVPLQKWLYSSFLATLWYKNTLQKNLSYSFENFAFKIDKIHFWWILHQGICVKKDPPSLAKTQIWRGGLFCSNFRPPSAAEIHRVPPMKIGRFAASPQKRPPLISRDPKFEGGVFFGRGGLFWHISPDRICIDSAGDHCLRTHRPGAESMHILCTINQIWILSILNAKFSKLYDRFFYNVFLYHNFAKNLL